MVFGTKGPPNKLSIKVGISTVGMASLGISDPAPACPANFFLEGAEDLTVLPSYRTLVSPDGLFIVISVTSESPSTSKCC